MCVSGKKYNFTLLGAFFYPLLDYPRTSGSYAVPQDHLDIHYQVDNSPSVIISLLPMTAITCCPTLSKAKADLPYFLTQADRDFKGKCCLCMPPFPQNHTRFRESLTIFTMLYPQHPVLSVTRMAILF